MAQIGDDAGLAEEYAEDLAKAQKRIAELEAELDKIARYPEVASRMGVGAENRIVELKALLWSDPYPESDDEIHALKNRIAELEALLRDLQKGYRVLRTVLVTRQLALGASVADEHLALIAAALKGSSEKGSES
jgi:hypothetical protein